MFLPVNPTRAPAMFFGRFLSVSDYVCVHILWPDVGETEINISPTHGYVPCWIDLDYLIYLHLYRHS